jgi:hypothetical protein
MCEPTLILAGVSALTTGISQYQQGQTAKKTARYNARVSENRATEVQNRAITAESEERQKASELQGRQRAIQAAKGVSVDTGTALRVQEDTALIGEVNAMRIRENARSQTEALETEAELTRFQGENAARQGTLGAISTVAAGAGKVADKWHQFSTPEVGTFDFAQTDFGI